MQRQHSSQATSTLGNTPNLNIGFLHQKENPTTVTNQKMAKSYKMAKCVFSWPTQLKSGQIFRNWQWNG